MTIEKLKTRFIKLGFEIDACCYPFSSSDMQKKRLTETFELLRALYSEKFRHHHTLENHILPMLQLFDEIKSKFIWPLAVEIAIFMHDVIYNPLSQLNEEASAVFANSLLPKNIYNFTVSRIITSIKREGQERDEQLFNDLDFSILGVERGEYKKYADNIYKEYSPFYTAAEYQAGRIGWIKKTLAKKNIFFTVIFRTLFEDQAKKNLTWEVEKLTGIKNS